MGEQDMYVLLLLIDTNNNEKPRTGAIFGSAALAVGDGDLFPKKAVHVLTVLVFSVCLFVVRFWGFLTGINIY